MHIEFHGSSAIVESERTCFTYEQTKVPDALSSPFKTPSTYFVGNYIVHPYGQNNELPIEIRDTVKTNYLAPGLLTKKTQLLWGSGPRLYYNRSSDGVVRKEWTEDNEVQDWLDNFDADNYLLKEAVDYNHLEGNFTKIFLSRSNRVGNPKISKLEHMSPEYARLATKRNGNPKKADTVVEMDYSFKDFNKILDYRDYPMFDYKSPFKHKVSAFYSNLYSFCSDYYTIPDIYGSLEWIKRSTAVPLIFKALSKNSLNVKYHIVSPEEFWNVKRKDLKEQCVNLGKVYKEKYLDEYRENLLRQISEILSGDEAVGRFWHTTKVFSVEGVNLLEHGWEIKPIDQNIKDFIESQIKLSERADNAVASGLNIHGALGNISKNGTANSGSEQLYALKNYLLTGIDIPEMIITKAVNYAIKANWPEKRGLKLGFYHDVPEKESEVSPSNRIANN